MTRQKRQHETQAVLPWAISRAARKSGADFNPTGLSIRTPGNVVDFARQDNAEGRTMASPGLILEHPAVLFNDPSGNRQAEARARFLRAEERVEKALLDLGRDAIAIVAHFKNNGLGLTAAERDTRGARAQSDRAWALNGFSVVANEVDEHLFQMPAVGADEQLRDGFNHHLHFAAFQVWGHQPLNFAEKSVCGDGFQLGIRR